MGVKQFWVLVFFTFAGLTHEAHAASQSTTYPSRPAHLLVRHRRHVSAEQVSALHAVLGTKVVRRYQLPDGLELVRLPAGLAAEDAAAQYMNDPSVLYAEPDYIVHALDTPSTAQFSDQWALHNTGQSGGKVDVDINALGMWNLTTGSSDVVIGIVDTGISYNHPALAANVWVNPLEIAGNGIDDDNDGYIDDIHGINAIKKNGDPMDDNGHGTHVAGIIGAQGSNSVSGVNKKVSMIACKFLDADGSGNVSDAIACLNYFLALAKRQKSPLNIVATNNSWGGGPYSQALYDAIQAQEQQGILFITAADNATANNDVVDTYPANYKLPNIISVGAIDRNDQLAPFSDYGKHSVHVTAPGVDILSTYLNNGYELLSGTSMATPYVTGIAAMLKSHDPTLDWKSIKNLIVAGGVPSTGATSTLSGRRVRGAGTDGTGSLTCQNQVVTSRLAPTVDSMSVAIGSAVGLSELSINCARPNGPVSVSLGAAGGSVQLVDDGTGIFSKQWAPQTAGQYSLNFPGADVVSVLAYDPSNWGTYQSQSAPFNYRTITGTPVHIGDDTVNTITSDFPVHFAGDTRGFTKLYVDSNGGISMTENVILSADNVALPFDSFATLIAPYWEDLMGAGSQDVYYQTLGSAPNRELVIEWRDVPQYGKQAGFTFQVVLFEDSSDILFNYKNVTSGDNAFDKGVVATIGVQTSAHAASMFSFHQASIANNTALLFTTGGKSSSNGAH